MRYNLCVRLVRFWLGLAVLLVCGVGALLHVAAAWAWRRLRGLR